jgi:secondary thiamine-phosphate synthase enzyme
MKGGARSHDGRDVLNAQISMSWHQTVIRLKPRPRGFHLITSEIVTALPELARVKIGLAHFFIQHTSASLAVNENADPDVRGDLERWFDRAVPENAPYFEHTAEGADDMPAHVKSTLLGASVTIPIRDGRLALGTWQGIYLGEHRDQGGARTLVATLQGESVSGRGVEASRKPGS